MQFCSVDQLREQSCCFCFISHDDVSYHTDRNSPSGLHRDIQWYMVFIINWTRVFLKTISVHLDKDSDMNQQTSTLSSSCVFSLTFIVKFHFILEVVDHLAEALHLDSGSKPFRPNKDTLPRPGLCIITSHNWTLWEMM